MSLFDKSRLLTRPPRLLAGIAVLLVQIGTASPARADLTEASSPRLPLSEAQRPLTLPSLVLDPELRVEAVRQGAQGTFLDLDVHGAVGITDNLTVGALLLPLQLTGPAGNGFTYGQAVGNRGPSVDATYRFVRGKVEVAAGLALRLFTLPGLHGGAIIPSVPVRVHVTDHLRIDAAAVVNITRATLSPVATPTTPTTVAGVGAPSGTLVADAQPSFTVPANAVRIDVPVSLLYNVTEPFDIGVTSGLTIYDVNNASNTTGIPLGFFCGYAIAGEKGPVLDLNPYFTFPYLVMPGRNPMTNTNQFVVGLNAIGHLYL